MGVYYEPIMCSSGGGEGGGHSASNLSHRSQIRHYDAGCHHLCICGRRPPPLYGYLHGASILALSTIYDLHLSKTERTVVGRSFDWMDGRSDAVFLSSGSFLNWSPPAQKANGQPPGDWPFVQESIITRNRALTKRTR